MNTALPQVSALAAELLAAGVSTVKLLRFFPWPPAQLSERWNREYSLRHDSISLGELLVIDPVAQQHRRIQWNGDVTMISLISRRGIDHLEVVVVERNASALQFRPQMLGVLIRRYRHSRRHISSVDGAIVLHFSSRKSMTEQSQAPPGRPSCAASRCRAHVSHTVRADQRHRRQRCHPWWWAVEFRRIR